MTKTVRLSVCVLALIGTLSAVGAPLASEAQVRSAEQAWVHAEDQRDAKSLRQILDEKFIVTFGTDAPLNRDAFIKAVTSGTDTDISQTLSDQIVRVYRDTAVSTGIDTVRAVTNGKPHIRRYRYTATYIKRAGRWVALGEQMVRIPDIH